MSLSPISGSIIDLSPWLQARANRLTTNATDVANTLKSFENARDILNRRSSFNKVKNLLNDADNYEGIKKSVAEDDAWTKEYESRNTNYRPTHDGWTQGADKDAWFDANGNFVTAEDLSKLSPLDLADKGFEYGFHPDIRNKNKPAILGKDDESADELSQYEERMDALKANRKYLEDNADTYAQTIKDYGWMRGPDFNAVIEDYIINGNPANLVQLKQNYLENKRAEAEAKNKAGDLNEAYAEAMDNVNAINTYKDQLDPNIVAEKRVSINKVIRQLRKAGRENEAKTLEQALGVKEETLTNNRTNNDLNTLLQKYKTLKDSLPSEPNATRNTNYDAELADYKKKTARIKGQMAELKKQIITLGGHV